ncbi:hypothetical protein Rumeso_00541 [Rubellimicrobium mesophilum DSM 19309]|uniref:Uncharacterized protein n=1 Tax=Rubellimicrobium mesophilum DSM 19309 TaxID=442562 RepID=A0A017HVM9_9RHOB|nr:hypothetical protein [Rubellimicrobium mesophilum]EYD77814.1 hypothetical protein Rumeso_00541 [Rubellimicrobium mesophilum DSM 19309]
MSGKAAAWVFAGLAAGVVAFHLAVIGGAPWGSLTMGGRWPGVVPGPAKGLSALSALLVAGMAVVMLARAGVLGLRMPRGAVRAVLLLSGLAVVANAVTPSAPERALWLPVTLAMLAAALVVSKA